MNDQNPVAGAQGQSLPEIDPQGVISKQEAREIAGEWHGGQGSAMYALSSSGYVNARGIVPEAERALAEIDEGTMRAHPFERDNLRALIAYAKAHDPLLRAERMGWHDAAVVISLALDELGRGDLAMFGGRVCLIDGSAYSPSWRALPHGNAVWELASDVSDGDDTSEAGQWYSEALDEKLDAWSGPNGEYLVWEDGMLFLCGPDLDSTPGLPRLSANTRTEAGRTQDSPSEDGPSVQDSSSSLSSPVQSPSAPMQIELERLQRDLPPELQGLSDLQLRAELSSVLQRAGVPLRERIGRSLTVLVRMTRDKGLIPRTDAPSKDQRVMTPDGPGTVLTLGVHAQTGEPMADVKLDNGQPQTYGAKVLRSLAREENHAIQSMTTFRSITCTEAQHTTLTTLAELCPQGYWVERMGEQIEFGSGCRRIYVNADASITTERADECVEG